MSWAREIIWLILGAVGSLAGAGVVWVASSWPALSQESRANLVVAGIGAVGTLILATVTAVSVIQNRRTVSELKKDRVRPLVEDELHHLIQPAINSMEENIDNLDSKHGVDWYYVDETGVFGGGRLFSPLDSDDSAALFRIKANEPELWELMNEHDDKVTEIGRLARRIATRLEVRIERYLAEKQVEMVDDVQEDMDKFLSAVLKELEEFGPDSKYYEFWENHGPHLKSLLEEEERQELKTGIGEYRTLSEELLRALTFRKMRLQHRYGVSSKDLPVDEKPHWRNY